MLKIYSYFFFVLILIVNSSSDLTRNMFKKQRTRRYLVYPDGGPARAQFILGLGVPVDLKEQAVTVGAVIKFQYHLPTNSTEYTSRIYGFANTVSRGMDKDNSVDTEPEIFTTAYPSTPINQQDDDLVSLDDNENNTLIDIVFTDSKDNSKASRRRRNSLYTEGGLEEVLGGATELPLQEAIRQQEIIDEQNSKETLETRQANRWDIYKVLEAMAERRGYSGKPCMLRTVCEAAQIPFNYESGLLAEIGHILFTPSTTKDELSHHTDNEYHAAERLGKQNRIDCQTLFPDCEGSILETFTQIGLNTLRSFG